MSTPFPSGQMPWYMMAVWYASQHSGFLAVLGLIATSIMGLALTAMFKRHARKRLGSGITNEKKNNNDEKHPSAHHVLPHRRVDSRWAGALAAGNDAALQALFAQANYWHEKSHDELAMESLQKVLSVDANNTRRCI